ncbi:GNAT family N-acetyltransferase [Sphingomonas sp. NSE70-1]|uniref:GNAT family N-acetyltransferase n=1 Tax=Sphingomonas caseinilyticus TaxID=2908205 RepID=A0ABT0RXF9_9SPHN|nr:GNAT family N-acetyltransferase [Sphingomonas caseinilyticus]MCL6699584.1 GNAT family N-acetyltransferase [Sphingomonas caseinilyticus]
MAAKAAPQVEIRLIKPGDRLTGLSLGDQAFAPLKTFAQRHAHAYERQSLARTYGAFDVANNDKLIGYITLVCGEVVIQEGDNALVVEDGLAYHYRQYPAVKIARLAVDRRIREAGIGNALVNLALGIARDLVSPNVGCRFVMVDAKRASVPWYDRRGFTMLDTAENRERDEPVMFVDLSKLG